MSEGQVGEADPCESIRAAVESVQADIASLEDALNPPDVPPRVEAQLRAILVSKRAEWFRLREALSTCLARAARRSAEPPASRRAADDSDPCASINDQLARVDDEFFAATAQLGQPDLSPERRVELEAVVARCLQQQLLLLQALVVCENRPPEPIEPEPIGA